MTGTFAAPFNSSYDLGSPDAKKYLTAYPPAVMPKLPVDRWAQMMGLNPLHFRQTYIPNVNIGLCDSALFEYDWQSSERVSRSQLARAILRAEDAIEVVLGFRLLPTWEADEYHSFESRPIRPENYNLTGTDVRGRRTGVRLDWGYFISGGVQTKTFIDTPTITWTAAPDGSQTGEVTVAVDAGTEACELEVYYPAHDGNDAFRIRPAAVVVSGVTATITFRRELCLLEARLADMEPRGSDYTDDNNFLTTVDVYQHWNDPSQQATIMWETDGCSFCTGSSTCPQCGFTVQTACLRIRDDTRAGICSVTPADWDADLQQFNATSLCWPAREPDAVRAWYLAGYRDQRAPCPAQDMEPNLAWAVAILAASYLDRPLCGCAGPQAAISRWQDDLAFKSGADQLDVYTPQSSPFGTTAGAVEAWRIINRPTNVQKTRIGRAILA